jgi:hypothetical protein
LGIAFGALFGFFIFTRDIFSFFAVYRRVVRYIDDKMEKYEDLSAYETMFYNLHKHKVRHCIFSSLVLALMVLIA